MFLGLIIYAFYFFLFVVLYSTESNRFLLENNQAVIESDVKEEDENSEWLSDLLKWESF
jgi:hypothetical protein